MLNYRIQSYFKGLYVISTVALATSCGTASVPTQTDAASMNTASAPKLIYKKTLHVDGEDGAGIKQLSFSPDSKELAIFYENPHKRRSDLVLIDLSNGQIKTKITDLPILANPLAKVTWSPNGKLITLGTASYHQGLMIWSALTGKLVEIPGHPDANMGLAFDSDGSRLLVNTTGILCRKGDEGFDVYDTESWTYKHHDSGGLCVDTVSWTSDGKVFLTGHWPRDRIGDSIDGLTPKMSDSVMRLMDVDGKDVSRSALLGAGIPFAAIPGLNTTGIYFSRHIIKASSADIALSGFGRIVAINMNTLKILSEYAAESQEALDAGLPNGMLGENIAITPDGKYVFVMGYRGGRSLIYETQSGKHLLWFDGGVLGLAISPDGKMLAQGKLHQVDISNIGGP